MKNQNQHELRREGMVGQALASFSASFLFLQSYITKPTEPFIVPEFSYLALSISFLVLAFFFIISPINRWLLSKLERIAQILWLALSYISLAGIMIAWLNTTAGLDPTRFWFHWYFWLGILWILIFSYHLIRSAHYHGKKMKYGDSPIQQPLKPKGDKK